MPLDTGVLAAAMGNLKPETFMGHWKDIQNAKEVARDAAMAVARAKKAAKRDGIDLDVLSLVEKLTDIQDQDELNAHLRKLVVYSTWRQLPLAAFVEGITLPVPAPRESASADFLEWLAEKNGLAAGKAGSPQASNPETPGSAQFVGWDKGWRKGFKGAQGKIAAGMVKGAEIAATAGKRGRGNSQGARAN